MQTVTQARDNYHDKLRKLWLRICEMDSAQREQVINSLDEDTIIAMRSLPNLFKKPVVALNKKNTTRLLAFNVINLREKYCRRFAMTSLIGFVYRMASEYIPPEAENYPSENEPRFADLFHKKARAAERRIPEEKLKSLGTPEAEEQLEKLRRFYLNEDKREAVVAAETTRKEVTRLAAELKKVTETLTSVERKFAGRIAHDLKRGTKVPDEYLEVLKRVEDPPAALIEDLRQGLDAFMQIYRNAQGAVARVEASLQKNKAELAEREERVAEFERALGKEPVLPIERYQLTAEEEEALIEETKAELGIEQTAEDYIARVQEQIERFLDEYFRFNPDIHVRCAYKPNYKDPVRNVIHPDSNDPAIPEERRIIPPDDTFFRWNRYVDSNYEALRQATDDIYGEKSDLEFAIAPLEVFEGTREECEKQLNNYKHKYTDEFDADVFAAVFNNWNLLSSWEENRKNIDFYNEHTEVIKLILDQHKDDERIGAKLMKDRANKAKKKELKKNPAPPVAIKADRKVLESTPVSEKLREFGAKHVSEVKVNDFVIPKDAEEANDQEIEVNVHVISFAARKNRIRGKTSQWHFNIPAEPLPEGSVRVQTPADVNSQKN